VADAHLLARPQHVDRVRRGGERRAVGVVGGDADLDVGHGLVARVLDDEAVGGAQLVAVEAAHEVGPPDLDDLDGAAVARRIVVLGGLGRPRRVGRLLGGRRPGVGPVRPLVVAVVAARQDDDQPDDRHGHDDADGDVQGRAVLGAGRRAGGGHAGVRARRPALGEPARRGVAAGGRGERRAAEEGRRQRVGGAGAGGVAWGGRGAGRRGGGGGGGGAGRRGGGARLPRWGPGRAGGSGWAWAEAGGASSFANLCLISDSYV